MAFLLFREWLKAQQRVEKSGRSGDDAGAKLKASIFKRKAVTQRKAVSFRKVPIFTAC